MGLTQEPATAVVNTTYGANLTRLAKVKADCDPDNFFRRNHNIAPSVSDLAPKK